MVNSEWLPFNEGLKSENSVSISLKNQNAEKENRL